MKNTDERLWLNHLLKNGVVELRCFKDENIKSGIYDNLESLIKNIKFAMTDGWTIYQTINPSSLKATNGNLKPFQSTTKNKNITRIKTLFFDFDPVREKNTAATQGQIGEAYQMASKMVLWLQENGFPLPLVTGFSGNGGHEYYSVDLSINDKPMIDALYEILNKRFNSDTVSFDTSVKNSARIARTFGTINYKSGKRSRCEFSTGNGFVSHEVINQLVRKYAPPKKKPAHFVKAVGEKHAGIKPNHSIIGDCASAGLAPIESPETGKYWLKCINEASHSKTGDKDTVLWLNNNGFYSYFCSHDHCSHINAKELQGYLR